MGSVQANTARNVMGLRNTISLMIETRGVGLERRYLKRRVQTQLTLMTSVLRSAAHRASAVVKVKKYVDTLVRSQACQGEVAIDALPKLTAHTLQLVNPQTGLDEAVPVTWESALMLTDVVNTPRPCGYWLAADQGEIVERLRALGIKVDALSESGFLQTEAPPVGPNTFDNGGPAEFEAAQGSYYISLAQPLGNLVVAALDPGAKFGYVSQGLVSGADKLARVMAKPKIKR
jgi:hypothetical protein